MVLLFFLLISVIIIIIVSKKRKAEKEKRLKEEFRTNLKSHIASFANRDDFFIMLYNQLIEINKVDIEELNKLIINIPELKNNLSVSCYDLLSLSKNNICLFSQEKLDEYESQNILTTERITHDIIEVLPYLARFYKEYNLLYKYIYEETLTNKFVSKINSAAFGVAFHKESDYITSEEYDKAMSSFVKRVEGILNIEIESFIKKTLNLNPKIEISNSTDPMIKSLMAIANDLKDNEGLFMQFLDIWVKQMQKQGRKYGELHIELYHYFDELNEQIQKYLDWFSINFFRLHYPGLILENETPEECFRVLNLYTSGQMQGEYSKFYEQKALKNKK